MPAIYRALSLLLLLGLLSPALAKKLVIIDAGHGGHDRGGSYGKVYEKHLALDTAMRLEYYLKKKGYKTVMIRNTDNFVSLSRRVDIANKYKDAIFVSVHYNFTWREGARGLETFYYTRTGGLLASHCHHSIRSLISTADRGVKHARYQVIRKCKHPAILVEGGFLSNSSDRAKCKKGVFRDGIARGIVAGIVRFDKSGKW